ncbi:hypothetical protein IT570_01740 [Candidatus Sumerlaeota bacterium]|nr:hypothetical protein [Candidatus Sumerlaeota bacterium]
MCRTRLVESLVVAAVVLVFYWPLLKLDSMQSGGDSANLFWPIKLLIQESLWGQGTIPLWNPYSYLGAPLAASLQHAVFYPPDWFIYRLFPAHMGLNVGNLFHLLLAGCGAYWWLRVAMRAGGIASIACGAAFPCCAWFWGQQEHINQVAAISWLPLQALCAALYIQGRTCGVTFATWYAALSALAFLTGHPQEAFYAQFFCALLVLGGMAAGRFRGRVGELLLSGAVMGLITGLLVAVQLLMTLELQSHSRRQFKDPTYAISFSMPPDVLKTYLAPHHFGSFRDGYFIRDHDGRIVREADGSPAWDRRAYGEYGLYVGVPTLLLALAAFASRRRRFAVAMGMMLLLFTLLALGSNTDPRAIMSGNFTEQPQPGSSLYEMVLKIFPPARGFRVPARIIVLNAFVLVTLAAIGMEWIAGRLKRERGRVFAQLALGAAMLVSLFVPSRREKFCHPVPIGPALLELAQLKRANIAADERLFRLAANDDASLVAERHMDSTFAKGNSIYNRMVAIQPHMNAAAHIVTIDGYEEGLVPTARMKDFLYAFNRNFRQQRPDVALLTLLGVRGIYAELPIDESVYVRSKRFPEPIYLENPRWCGAAFSAEDVRGVDFARLDGPWWRKEGAPLPEIQREAVSFGTLIGIPRKRYEVTFPTLNSVAVRREDATDKSDAYLAMGWYPGWVSETENQDDPVEFVSAVHAFLPGGQDAKYRQNDFAGWRLLFRPVSYRMGLFLSALGAAIWCGLLGFSQARRRCCLTGGAATR